MITASELQAGDIFTLGQNVVYEVYEVVRVIPQHDNTIKLIISWDISSGPWYPDGDEPVILVNNEDEIPL